jgi:hypothetical protein
MTSFVLQKDPHLRCKTSLIVSTYRPSYTLNDFAKKTNSYTNLLPNLLIYYHVYQRPGDQHAILSSDKVLKGLRRDEFLDFGITPIDI